MKLTEKGIRGLELPGGKSDHIHWDDEIPGLGIRLRAGGSRNWIFQYKVGGKNRRMSLGAVIPESVRTIREQAAQLHAKVKLGQDPAGEKEENVQRIADRFEPIANRYLAVKKESLRPRSYVEVERHIQQQAKSLHGLPITDITRRDIATLFGTIKENSGPVAANRLRSTLSDFFRWAISEGIEIESNPVLNTNKSEEKSRDRVLKDHEIRTIWNNVSRDYGSVIKLLMLTGQRRDEIGGLRWSEITDDAIELPAERTKNKRPHIVPLSAAAKEILASQDTCQEYVFGFRGFAGWSVSKARLDQHIKLDHWTVHDIRRTVATRMNDLGILPHVVEAVLNHVSGTRGGVAGIYNRATYLREKTEALKLWADHLMAIIGDQNNILPLRRA